jgi:hypothetical protein
MLEKIKEGKVYNADDLLTLRQELSGQEVKLFSMQYWRNLLSKLMGKYGNEKLINIIAAEEETNYLTQGGS